MTYSQLKKEDRKILEKLYKQKHSCRFIAKILQVSHTTVSREIRRNSIKKQYCENSAEYHKRSRRILANKKLAKLRPKHLRYIFGKLKKTHSPEQIAAIFPSRFGFSISTRSIYLAIYRECARIGGDSHLLKYLRIRSRLHRKKWRLYHGPLPSRPNIAERPAGADNRSEYGHWELDLFHGSRRNKLAGLVIVERKSRYSIVCPLKAATQKEVNTALQSLLKRLKVLSITTDNGPEFTDFKALSSAAGGPVFYCNPYHSWEKGLVENTIGLCREFFPKLKPLPEDPSLYRKVQDTLNSRPKKVLGFATPKSFYKKLLTKTLD